MELIFIQYFLFHMHYFVFCIDQSSPEIRLLFDFYSFITVWNLFLEQDGASSRFCHSSTLSFVFLRICQTIKELPHLPYTRVIARWALDSEGERCSTTCSGGYRATSRSADKVKHSNWQTLLLSLNASARFPIGSLLAHSYSFVCLMSTQKLAVSWCTYSP